MSGDTLGAIDIREILRLLPHRYPFVMVDRLIDMRADEHAIGIKNVTFNEPQFMGHFPDNPVMPGVLVIEGMAQTAGTLVLWHLGELRRAGEKCISSPSTKRNSASPRCRATPSNITSTRSRTAATCGGTAPRPRSAARLIAEAEIGAMIAED